MVTFLTRNLKYCLFLWTYIFLHHSPMLILFLELLLLVLCEGEIFIMLFVILILNKIVITCCYSLIWHLFGRHTYYDIPQVSLCYIKHADIKLTHKIWLKPNKVNIIYNSGAKEVPKSIHYHELVDYSKSTLKHEHYRHRRSLAEFLSLSFIAFEK